ATATGPVTGTQTGVRPTRIHRPARQYILLRFCCSCMHLIRLLRCLQVIDKGCIDKNKYDFFLISQSVGQGNHPNACCRKTPTERAFSLHLSGTVSPTHYHVVYDKSELSADHIQQLTYKLCHMY